MATSGGISTITKNSTLKIITPISTATGFDSSTQYKAGDYCYRSGFLYRCTETHIGTWNAAHFTQTTIGAEIKAQGEELEAEIDEVKSDLSDEIDEVKSDLNKVSNGITQVLLSDYSWSLGRHITRGKNVNNPTASTNTMAMLASIPYDANEYFVLNEGWTVSFVSVENSLITGTPSAYYNTVGRIDMIDVYNNLTNTVINVFGDSLSINIRKSDSSNITPSEFNIDEVLQMYKINKKGDATKPKTWVAIGDSLTEGRYSQGDETVVTKTNRYCQYGYIASKMLGIDNYVEYGYGGMGYVKVANDGTYLTDVLDMDFGSPDIITICLGVNDRTNTLGDENSTSNDGTISGAIRNCCETLGDKYKSAQIIFLTPVNSWATGTLNTGWCKRSGTTQLSDIADMVKYWADLYGFAVIDMLNTCPINDFNIESLMRDELHPTMEAHYMLGHYLAGALPYRTC